MINIVSPNSPVSTPKTKKKSSTGAVVAGSNIQKDAPKTVNYQRDRRQGKERRQKSEDPLFNSRSGEDRRRGSNTPTIDIEV